MQPAAGVRLGRDRTEGSPVGGRGMCVCVCVWLTWVLLCSFVIPFDIDDSVIWDGIIG